MLNTSCGDSNIISKCTEHFTHFAHASKKTYLKTLCNVICVLTYIIRTVKSIRKLSKEQEAGVARRHKYWSRQVCFGHLSLVGGVKNMSDNRPKQGENKGFKIAHKLLQDESYL